MQPQNLYLTPKEKHFLALAVVNILDQLKSTTNNPKVNWTPEARKDIKDMLEIGNALKIKLTKLGFDMEDLPPYLDSDANEFFTKPS